MGAITSTRPELLERPVRIGRVYCYKVWHGMGGGWVRNNRRFHSEEESQEAADATRLMTLVERLK